MNNCVYVAWAALMYHNRSIELFKTGNLGPLDDNIDIVRSWHLANTKVRSYVGSVNDLDQANKMAEVSERASYLLQFVPVGNFQDCCVLDFIVNGPKYEVIAALIYEYNIALDLRVAALRKAVDINSMHTPLVLRSAISKHHSSAKRLGVTVSTHFLSFYLIIYLLTSSFLSLYVRLIMVIV